VVSAIPPKSSGTGGPLQTFDVDVSLDLGLDDFQTKALLIWRIVVILPIL
jgi:hypothetical protein